jgi:pyrroloquinoline quinone biosynthesis protein B
MTRSSPSLLLACASVSLLCAPAPAPAAASLPPVRAVVLGVVQDGGVPHIGCRQPLCVRARRDPSRRQRVACLGLIDDHAGQRFLIDATPDMASQLESLDAGRPPADPRRPVDGILLTHAHIGHYTGLMYFGREALDARAVPVYATARMAAFLRTSGPWSQLVSLGQIELREVEPGRETVLTPSLAFTPVRVPHRDELSDTVGYVVRGPAGALLYVPDIDKWEKWDRRVEDEVARVDTALLDGTFLAADELPGRSIDEVPHPLVSETAARLAALSSRVVFIHLNHTNPLFWDERPRRDLRGRGFTIATDGLVIPLERAR